MGTPQTKSGCMIPTQNPISPEPHRFKVRFPGSFQKYHFFIATLAVFFGCSSVFAADGWQSLFNGKDLTGWRANAYPESFTVENGAIRVNATAESSHLFYAGDLKEGAVRFKNFEFEATVRS